MVVMDRHLGDPEPGVLDLLHHLQADHPAVLLELDRVEDRPAHQPEVAVDVADLQPEQHLDGVVIDAADDDAVQRIGAADLVAVDQVDAIAERMPEHDHLRRIVLRVAVGVEHQLAGGRRETAAQGAAVAAILLVVDDADLRIGAGELVENLRGRIGAAVVDDDHLEVRASAVRAVRQRRDDQAGDRPAVVVCGEEHAEPRLPRCRRCHRGNKNVYRPTVLLARARR